MSRNTNEIQCDISSTRSSYSTVTTCREEQEILLTGKKSSSAVLDQSSGAKNCEERIEEEVNQSSAQATESEKQITKEPEEEVNSISSFN